MVARCDSKTDCNDKSDEMICDTLSRNKENFATYDKTLTPRSISSNFLMIKASVDINEVLKIGKQKI